MHCCKNARLFNSLLARVFKAFLLLFLLFLWSASSHAASSNMHIRNADLRPDGEVYSLDADLDIRFDEDVEEAVNKGVVLHFLVEFQVVSPRKYWFDDEIVTKTQNVSLSYHALTRQYLLMREGRQQSYDTLLEAKLELAEVRDWKVLEKSQIEKGESYRAALMMRLDQAKLPKAIQVNAIGAEEWALTSQKYEWMPKELSK
jgi:hypothetical protein